MFAFGHGLSYTSFAYGKAVASARTIAADRPLEITVPVTNTGSRAGKEVVQLYIADEKASMLRPVKELKGFQKVRLETGETVDVTFTVTLDDLKFFDDAAHAWVAEPGRFRALIGSSSTDIRATVPFEYK